MTQLLVSVNSVEEALAALDAGADLIDLKAPAEGALGALPLALITEIVRAVQGRRPVSATVGDLPMVPGILQEAVRDTAATGVDIVKIGFFDQENLLSCTEALSSLADKTRLVAVLFADQPLDFGNIDALAESGFHGVMLDTVKKNGQRLTDHLSQEAIRTFVEQARRHGLLTGLAGSLTLADIPALSAMRPGYLGFRGGLCDQSRRTSRLDPNRVGGAVSMLREYNTLAQMAV